MGVWDKWVENVRTSLMKCREGQLLHYVDHQGNPNEAPAAATTHSVDQMNVSVDSCRLQFERKLAKLTLECI